MASLAELWAQQQVRDPSGYYMSNAEGGGLIDAATGQPVAQGNPELGGGYPAQRNQEGGGYNYDQGRTLEQVLYGASNKANTDRYLGEIGAAAGLPANFDWKPYLAQVAQQSSGTAYGNSFQNWMIPVLQVAQAAAADHPQISQVLPQFGQGSAAWQAGEHSAEVLRREARNAGMTETAVMTLAGGFVGGAAAGLAGGGAGFADTAAATGAEAYGAAGSGGATAAGGGLASQAGYGGATAGIDAADVSAGQSLDIASKSDIAAGGGSAPLPAGVAAGGAAGGAGGAGAAGTGAAAAGTGTALSRILGGTSQGAGDYLTVAGQVLPAALSAYGSYQQSQAMQDLAKRYEGYGAPYRQTLADISADPNKFYQSPTATKATDAILQRLSIHGNPAGNPYSQALGVDALYKEYGSERDRLAGYGGLTQYNAAAPGAATGAINAQGSIYSDIGFGLGNTLNPKPTLAQQLAQYRAAGGTI